MSTSNFWSQENFPLYALMYDNYYEKRCDECGEYFDKDEDVCPICGGELKEFFNDISYDMDVEDIIDDLEKLNEKLTFFDVIIKDGYYEGIQLYVKESYYADICGFYVDEIDNPNVDNEDTKYYFDLCRSKCIIKFKREYKKLLKMLDAFAKEHGMYKLSVYARFSNGETWYSICA